MPRTIVHVWVAPAIGLLGLLALLAATIAAAGASLGEFSVMLNLLIAGASIGLIAIVFMNLGRSTALVRLASAAGVFWLVFLFALTAGDYLTR
jgi:cytochrome c oxidase subunit IV